MPSLLAELRPLVCMRFQDLFHSPSGVLFAFPSRYWFTIGRLRVLALEDGPPIFKQDFTCPALLISILVLYLNFRLRDYHPLRFNFPENLTNSNIKY